MAPLCVKARALLIPSENQTLPFVSQYNDPWNPPVYLCLPLHLDFLWYIFLHKYLDSFCLPGKGITMETKMAMVPGHVKTDILRERKTLNITYKFCAEEIDIQL